MSRRAIALFAAASSLLPSPALAGPEPIAGVTPWSQTTRAGLELHAALNLPDSPSAKGWLFAGQGEPLPEYLPNLYVGARFGLGYASFQACCPLRVVDQATHGNLLVSVQYAKTVVKGVLAVHAGGRVGIPLLLDVHSLEDAYLGVQGFAPVLESAQHSSLLEAGWGMDAFYPRRVPIRPGGGLEVGAADALGATLGRAELGVPIQFPRGGGNPLVSLELAAEGEWRHRSGAGVGLRVQSVFFLTPIHYSMLTPQDVVQVALEPFFALTPERLSLYARLGVLVAANEPLGGSDPMLALRLSAGWKLPR